MKDSRHQAAGNPAAGGGRERALQLEFHGIEYALLPGVYPPSEDTFLLLDAAVNEVKRGERALEVCCGTGLVALSVRNAGGRVVASDVYPQACRNARNNGLDVVRTDVLDAFRGPFDLLLCNPPYLPSDEDRRLADEPSPALDGGGDGLNVTRRLLSRAPHVLGEGGRLLFVASSLQGWDEVEGLLSWKAWDFDVVGSHRTFFEELRVYRCIRGRVA